MPRTKMFPQLSTYKLLTIRKAVLLQLKKPPKHKKTTTNPKQPTNKTQKKSHFPESLEKQSLIKPGLAKVLFLYNLLPLMQPRHLPTPRASPRNTPVLAALSWLRLPPHGITHSSWLVGTSWRKKKIDNIILFFFFPPMKYLEVFDVSKNEFKFAISALEVFINSECL